MALRVTTTSCLEEKTSIPQIGDIIPAHGRIMRIETITVQDFVMYALSGGVPLHGFDQILIDDRFVTSTGEIECVDESVESGAENDEDEFENDEGDTNFPTVIGGVVTVIWVNHV